MLRTASFRLKLIALIIAACGLVLATRPSPAQSATPVFDASNLRQPTQLNVRWLVHAGDDPAYAQPSYDDSQWIPFDPNSPLNAVFPDDRPVVVWYRLRVKVSPTETGLALSEWNLSRAFEIYVNGERLIASGRVAPYDPYTPSARIVSRIPDRLLASGSILIAMRVAIAPSEWASGQNPGYFITNLSMGQEQTLYRDNWLAIIGENSLDWVNELLLIGLGFVAIVLYAAQRRQTVYLWIFAVGALRLAQLPLPFVTTFHNIPQFWMIIGDLPRLVSPYFVVSLYFAFAQQRVGWRWRTVLIVAGILDAISGLQGWFFQLSLPMQFLTNIPFIIILSVVIPVVLAIHWRRGNREAGILLIPVILFSLYVYAEVGLETLFQFPASRVSALHWLNLIDRYPAGPFAVSLNGVSGILSTIALAIILLLRSTTMSRRQALLESELEAAQQVQQVLVPEQTDSVPGFIVESVYQPAQQVGGDFFQILPAGEGGLLVVVGDVAGKGLPAAMLVSVLIGAIRGVADYTSDPAELLENLNERLVGRAGGAFSTALAAHIAADGRVAIANAGHLYPYLDGREVELPGALPLGVASGIRYETTRLRIEPGGRLTFYSDGVVEAQSSKGELFGFERGREHSTKPAAAIVEAAKRFGQQDDITVVTIERSSAIASAA
jgi:hypothetical protein